MMTKIDTEEVASPGEASVSGMCKISYITRVILGFG
jgi:hypothetical protein